MKSHAEVVTLHDAGLDGYVTEARQSPDNGQPQGRMWKQSPPADANVSPGTTATIFVNPD